VCVCGGGGRIYFDNSYISYMACFRFLEYIAIFFIVRNISVANMITFDAYRTSLLLWFPMVNMATSGSVVAVLVVMQTRHKPVGLGYFLTRFV
jgi:hypothetical protein